MNLFDVVCIISDSNICDGCGVIIDNASYVVWCFVLQVLIVEDEGAATGVGNLCIRSPGMFSEYWNLPEVHIYMQLLELGQCDGGSCGQLV